MSSTTPRDLLLDGTLYKVAFLPNLDVYRVYSITPVDGCNEPMKLHLDYPRTAVVDLQRYDPYTTTTLEMGIADLQLKIPAALATYRLAERGQLELEALDCFGSF